MTDTGATTDQPNADTVTPVIYGGVQDRPDDVNHPDNLPLTNPSSDPSQGTPVENKTTPTDFEYDPETDTYTRITPVD